MSAKRKVYSLQPLAKPICTRRLTVSPSPGMISSCMSTPRQVRRRCQSVILDELKNLQMMTPKHWRYSQHMEHRMKRRGNSAETPSPIARTNFNFPPLLTSQARAKEYEQYIMNLLNPKCRAIDKYVYQKIILGDILRPNKEKLARKKASIRSSSNNKRIIHIISL